MVIFASESSLNRPFYRSLFYGVSYILRSGFSAIPVMARGTTKRHFSRVTMTFPLSSGKKSERTKEMTEKHYRMIKRKKISVYHLES